MNVIIIFEIKRNVLKIYIDLNNLNRITPRCDLRTLSLIFTLYFSANVLFVLYEWNAPTELYKSITKAIF